MLEGISHLWGLSCVRDHLSLLCLGEGTSCLQFKSDFRGLGTAVPMPSSPAQV